MRALSVFRNRLLPACMMVTCTAWAQTFSESFNSLTIDSRVTADVIPSGACSTSGGADIDGLSMSIQAGSGNWGVLVSQNYPKSWAGTGATQSWAINSGVMATHAEDNAPYDDGLAWISRSIFDKSKYLTATSTLSLSACANNAAGCMAGLSLIASEGDYREISLKSTGLDGFGNLQVRLTRFAPCDERDLLNASGQSVSLTANQLTDLRIDYLGPEGGGWRYWLGSTPLYISTSSGMSTTEPSTFLGAPLQANPRVAIYYTAAGTSGSYVEGNVDSVNVFELQKVGSITASASNTYPGSSPSYAVDDNSASSWNAGAGATQWIELDLGTTKTTRKIRLLPNQSPSGSTTHIIYAGNTPNPATAVNTLSGVTSDSQWLDADLFSGVSARYVRVVTTSSPSWISWREIEIYE